MKKGLLLILVLAIVIGFFIWYGAKVSTEIELSNDSYKPTDSGGVSSSAEADSKDSNELIPTPKDSVDGVEDSVNEPKISLPSLTHEEIRRVLTAGVSWMQNAQEENGHLKYEYLPVADSYASDDNVVRQMGALYELGEVFVRDSGDKYGLADTLENLISYAESRTETITYLGTTSRCITSNSFQCSTGATSLGLIGIIDLVEARPDLEAKYKPLIDDYTRFLISMRNPGAGIRSKYVLFDDDDEQPADESSFFNGEAFLALVRYNIYSPSEEAKRNIDELFEYFVEVYGDTPDANFYLWGMAAIKDLQAQDPNPEYAEYTRKYTDWRVASQQTLRDSKRNRCAYIEGVVSAYSILEDSSSDLEKQRYMEEIDYWLSKSAELQIGKGGIVPVTVGGRPETFEAPNPEQAEGGFLTALNVPRQRIDFTQHCISSYLQKLVDIDRAKL